MKRFSAPVLLGLLLVLLSATPLPKNEQVKWVVQKSSTLMVQGKTNVNKFSCGITRYEACDTIVFSNHPSLTNSMLLNGAICLDVYRFDCFNKIMTSELRKTLKAETYPRLKIRFITLDKVAFAKNQHESICGVVDIDLAGVRKRYTVSYSFSTGDDPNVIELVGTKTICFSDFFLKPPKKLNGMVQAKDELDIEFHLVMKKAGA